MKKEIEDRLMALMEEFTKVVFKVNCKDKEELATYVKINGVSDVFDDLQTFALLIEKAQLLNLDIGTNE